MRGRNAMLADRGSIKSYDPPWYDKAVNWLTDAVYGENATAQDRSWVNKLAGPENPFNVPAQASQGMNAMLSGYNAGDYGQMAGGALQAGLAATPLIGARAALRASRPFRNEVYYHGTAKDFDKFSLAPGGSNTGTNHRAVFMSRDPAEANNYVNGLNGPPVDGSRILPVNIRGRVKQVDYDNQQLFHEALKAKDMQAARRQGYDGITWRGVRDGGENLTDVTAVFDPRNIRGAYDGM